MDNIKVMKEIIGRQSEMLDFYRRYYRELYDYVMFLAHSDESPMATNQFEETLTDQDFDLWAQLGHLDSLEKTNKGLIKFPMLKHKPFFKEDNNETE